MQKSNRLAVDIGGTFTDVVLETEDRRVTTKVLTTARAPEQGVVAGMEIVLRDAGLGFADMGLMIHGTTLATNAIIERKGAATALIATEGFRDTLDIADESRYDQYDIFIDKPRPLIERKLRLTVPERVDVHGTILLPLDEAAVQGLIPRLRQLGAESVAVCFLHSYANPAHEQRVREILADAMPEMSVSLSCEVSPEIREYERTSTTAANAYVQPLMAGYLTRLRQVLAERGLACPILLMTSGGGLTTLDTAIRFPIRLVESGPAGGAILASVIAAECAEDKVLSFDMGGTTAKICLIENRRPHTSRSFEVDRAARFRKGSGLPLRIPVIEMIEIGAGGGSIARVDNLKRIVVGPHSAGSEPGPACYGRGGENPTVTDADLVLGRIDPARFAGGTLALDEAAAAAAIDRAVGAGLGLATALAAFGVSEIVDENMANAARVHSVESGVTIADHTLIAFGGAAPLHAARLAEKLGIGRVIVPANAGVGSAVGFLRAPIAYDIVRSRYMRLRGFDPDLANEVLDAMQAEATGVVRQGAPEAPLVERRQAFMRYVGQGHEIAVPLSNRRFEASDTATLREDFEREYAAAFQRIIPNAEIEIMTWALSIAAPVPEPGTTLKVESTVAAQAAYTRDLFDADRETFRESPVYARQDLSPGSSIEGPAIIVEAETSTVITGSFRASIDNNGYIVMDRRS